MLRLDNWAQEAKHMGDECTNQKEKGGAGRSYNHDLLYSYHHCYFIL